MNVKGTCPLARSVGRCGADRCWLWLDHMSKGKVPAIRCCFSPTTAFTCSSSLTPFHSSTIFNTDIDIDLAVMQAHYV